jgi:pyruvoyl-dependent arginine decarboxylase
MVIISSGKMIDPTKIQGTVYPFVSLGYGENRLDAFDDAEVSVGMEAINAVRFTSFIPVGPNGRWKVNNIKEAPEIKNGEAIPMAFQYVYSRNKYISAVIAIGLNKDSNKPGIIMEYARTIYEDELEKIAIQDVWNAFKRRKDFGWELDRVIIEKIGDIPKSGKILCALAGAIYVPEII